MNIVFLLTLKDKESEIKVFIFEGITFFSPFIWIKRTRDKTVFLVLFRAPYFINHPILVLRHPLFGH